MFASWVVTVGERIYGPFTDAQMAAFVAEGRLAAHSMIAQAGESRFRPAGEEPGLAFLFRPSAPAPLASTDILFKSPESVVAAPMETMTSSDPQPAGQPAGTFGRKDDGPKTGERAHMVIISDMKSGSIHGLEEAVHKLGQAYPILPQVWLLRTDQSVNAVRNALVQVLGKLDVLFVVDATNNKAAWFNFGPEADARIKRIWMRSSETSSRLQPTG